MDLASVATALLGTVLGGGLTTAWVALRKDKREEPIDAVRAVAAWRGEAAEAARVAHEALTRSRALEAAREADRATIRRLWDLLDRVYCWIAERLPGEHDDLPRPDADLDRP